MSAHHDEQQDIENAKHLWRSGGKWLFAALVAAAIGYLGHVSYQSYQRSKDAEASALAAQVKGDAAKLQAIQQNYPASMGATQATMQAAAQAFDAGKYDQAAAAYRWVLDHQKAAPVQATAIQSLANVYLQQKKYDDAHKILATPVEAGYLPLIDETRGDVYAAQGKAKEAAAAYKAALDKLPEDSAAREMLDMKAAAL